MIIEAEKIVLYKKPEYSLLEEMVWVINNYQTADKVEVVKNLYSCIYRLIERSERHGFNGNIWSKYLTYTLVNNENPFTKICERRGKPDGTILTIAKNDLLIYKQMYEADLLKIDYYLGTNLLAEVLNYVPSPNIEYEFNDNTRVAINELDIQISSAKDIDEFIDFLTAFYKKCGVGKIGLCSAFRYNKDNDGLLEPICHIDKINMSDIIGYEIQKQKLIDNTDAFVNGEVANNVLLFGDSGTGKSTSIRALINMYADKGLKLIEVYKHQFIDLPNIINSIKNRNYRFILFMDDLSFEEFETEYKYLKAVIEGGIEKRPDNVLIYATSNRRHLIRETWSDKTDNDEELHRGDTIQEKLSLVDRFGITIYYEQPQQMQYLDIVRELAIKNNIEFEWEKLRKQAVAWEMNNNGRSGRAAQQFINYIINTNKKEN